LAPVVVERSEPTTALASPKSISLTCPEPSNAMFAGLMSR
jgi:hypothetical protein